MCRTCAARRQRCSFVSLYSKGDIKKSSSLLESNSSVVFDCHSLLLDVQVDFLFCNNTSAPLEAVLSFHEEDHASIYYVEVIIGGRKILGMCTEKDKAVSEYDDSISKGERTVLLEQEASLFSLNVGNLAPNDKVLVVMRYSKMISRFDGKHTIASLPMTLLRPRDKFQCRVVVSKCPPIPVLPSYAQIVEQTGDSCTIEIRESQEDFFEIKIPVLEKVGFCLEQNQENVAFMASFFPKELENFPGESEIVFLVDRSGSMGGSKIRAARQALQVLIRALVPNTRFEIISFGTDYAGMFGTCVNYTEDNFAKATQEISKFEANFGGTVIDGPLDDILSDIRDDSAKHYNKQVIVITDGRVENNSQVIDVVSAYNNARVFALGIGHDADESLVAGIAAAGKGTYEMAGEDEIEEKVALLTKNILRPSIQRISVEWEIEPLQMSNIDIPVFLEQPVKICGFLKKGQAQTVKVVFHVSGANEKSFERFITIDPSAMDKGDRLHRLVAQEFILNGTKGNALLSKEEATQLAIKYNIVSKYTSFIAVEKNNTNIRSNMGMTISTDGSPRVLPERLFAKRTFKSTKCVMIDGKPVQVLSSSHSKTGKHGFAKTRVVYIDEEGNKKDCLLNGTNLISGSKPSVTHHKVSLLQKFSGLWECSDELAKAVGRKDEIELLTDGPDWMDDDEDLKIWATFLAIAWLYLQFEKSKGEWDLLETKAKKALLEKGLIKESQYAEYLEQAKAWLKKK